MGGLVSRGCVPICTCMETHHPRERGLEVARVARQIEEGDQLAAPLHQLLGAIHTMVWWSINVECAVKELKEHLTKARQTTSRTHT